MSRLLSEVNVTEMLEMRQRGMSNAEIASSLDASYQTVLRLIGKQPASVRRNGKKTVPCKKVIREDVVPVRALTEVVPVAKEEKEEEPCLIMSKKNIILEGNVCSYMLEVPAEKNALGIVRIKRSLSNSGETLEVAFKDIDTMIGELNAIKKNAESIVAEKEFW